MRKKALVDQNSIDIPVLTRYTRTGKKWIAIGFIQLM